MQDKKDNKIYKVKSLDEITLKDSDDLFVERKITVYFLIVEKSHCHF